MIRNNSSSYHIILDVNGLLIARGEATSISNINPDFVVNDRPCYKRPYLYEFLSFCIANFQSIGIWTSMSKYNAIPCIEHILKSDNHSLTGPLPLVDKPWALNEFDKEKNRLSMLWTQDSCHIRKHSIHDSDSWKHCKPIMFKDLYYIWHGNSRVDKERMDKWGRVIMKNKSQFDLNCHSNTETQSLNLRRSFVHKYKQPFKASDIVPLPQNTVIIDDSLYKLALTPNNAIIIPEYKIPSNEGIHDNELIILIEYLDKLIESKTHDIREWISKTPYDVHRMNYQIDKCKVNLNEINLIG